MRITWITCGDGRWCSLERLDLSAIRAATGVYVIWHRGQPGRVVCVGQGNIAERLAGHRADPAVMQHGGAGGLLVTWAAVSGGADRDGIVRYLADRYRPLVSDAHPVVVPVEVNLPGAA
ncbi:MAG: hypothetical protein Kow0026_23880 [Oricola sp.]